MVVGPKGWIDTSVRLRLAPPLAIRGEELKEGRAWANQTRPSKAAGGGMPAILPTGAGRN